MKIQKHVLSPLEKCYAVNAFPLGGRMKYLFASEVAAPCYCFDAQTLERETVWTQDGGTMGLVPFHEDEFLAIQNFFPPFAAKASKIVRVKKTHAGFAQKDYLHLPYLHRFGLMEHGARRWLVLATLCESKMHKDDWTKPGSVYVTELDESGRMRFQPQEILGGQFHHHGFYIGRFASHPCAAIGSDQGAYLLMPPEEGTEWKIERMTDVPAGEVWLEDLDGDGIQELITLEAFHGTTLRVYHLTEMYTWACVWTCPIEMTFAHALWCGDLFGMRCGVCSSRREAAPLFLFWHERDGYHTEILEEGASASNVWVSAYQGKSCLLSANHGQNQCVMYTQE